MKKTNGFVYYYRTNKPVAAIYVRGNKKEMQEMLCRLCAMEKGYEVSFATDNIDDVKGCNVLLATNPSRISRDQTEYYEIMKDLKAKDIDVEFATEYENLLDNLELARYLLK